MKPPCSGAPAWSCLWRAEARWGWSGGGTLSSLIPADLAPCSWNKTEISYDEGHGLCPSRAGMQVQKLSLGVQETHT